MPENQAARSGPGADSLDRELETFTMVGRGPARRLLERAGLVNREGRIPPPRLLLLVAIAWLPALALSAVRGQALGWPGGLGFLEDLVTQVRLLVVLPLYLLLEGFINARLRKSLGEIVRRGIVLDRERYAASLRRLEALAGSGWAELVLLGTSVAVAYGSHAGEPAWWNGGGRSWTPAGWWYIGVAAPIVHFLFLRWIWRFLVWAGFLVSLARMDLKLVPTHPDGAGGLGFVATMQCFFGTVTATAMTVLSARIGNRVLHHGESLRTYQMEIVAAVGIMLVLIVGPLLVFTPLLIRVKREGKYAYGGFGTGYVRDFNRKWIHGEGADPSPLGSPDIRSLADLANSYRLASGMRVVLVGRQDFLQLLVMNALPLLPLALTLMSLPELLMKVLSLLK